MSIDVAAAMTKLGVALGAVTGLRVYDYPSDNVAPPAVVVGLPHTSYDVTYARGLDRSTFPIHVVVGKVSDRASVRAASPYVAGAGAASIKAALELDRTLTGSVDSLRVTDSDWSTITVAAVDYLAASFDVEVIA